jgi:hypothetical protein
MREINKRYGHLVKVSLVYPLNPLLERPSGREQHRFGFDKRTSLRRETR